MTATLVPLYLTAAWLLVVSGLAKLRRPGPAADMLGELGVRAPRLVARVAALVELAAAVLMLVRPSLGSPIACGLYLGFAALLLAQLVRGSTSSCGCLGSAVLPPTHLHVALNIVLASCCALARPDALDAFRDPIRGAVVLLGAATIAWALSAGLELVPQTLRAYRRPAA